MTEDEAKTKWCPKVQFFTASSSQLATNRDEIAHLIGSHSNCIASDCMWWVPEPSGYDGHNAAEIKRGGHCGAVKS